MKVMTHPLLDTPVQQHASAVVREAEAITARAALTWADARFAYLCALSGALPGEY